MKHTKQIFPSLISADILNLERVVQQLDPYCAGYHIDIMDNHFVPNLTWGPEFANAIARVTSKQVWVHLMVTDPLSVVDRLVLPVDSIVTIHVEMESKIIDALAVISAKKWRPSIAINPNTNVRESFEYLDEMVDHVLIMSVAPGFSGQIFVPSALQSLKTLVEYRAQNGLDFTIGMDGGVDATNIAGLARAGVDQFAVATAVFGQGDPVQNVQRLQELAT